MLCRQWRRPTWLDDGDNLHRFVTPEDRYRQVYFEVVDYCCGELEKRFDQSDLATVSSLEAFMLDIANGISSSVEFPFIITRVEQEID